MTKFYNCNFPNKIMIPPKKPKEFKKYNFYICKDGITLYQDNNNKIWFKFDKNYYMGIEFEIIKRLGVIQEFETIGRINIDLINWTGEPLGRIQEDLLHMYLKIIK